MEIKQLKEAIENNQAISFPLMLKYSDNSFIANQYCNAIARNQNKELVKINLIEELPSEDNLFDTEDNRLFVIETVTFSEVLNNELNNLIVICSKIEKDQTIDFIEIPKIVEWQLEDFLKMRMPGLTKAHVEWLCKIAKYDVYRLDNECKKIEIFPKNQQKIIFDLINADDGYCDLNDLTIFSFINTIMQRDMITLTDIMNNIMFIDIEPTGVVTLLIRSFKKLIEVNSGLPWDSSMTSSEKEFGYYKRNMMGYYDKTKLPKIYEFLTSIDYELKSGNLDNKQLLSYVVTKVLTM